jgi:hypothetical protein
MTPEAARAMAGVNDDGSCPDGMSNDEFRDANARLLVNAPQCFTEDAAPQPFTKATNELLSGPTQPRRKRDGGRVRKPRASGNAKRTSVRRGSRKASPATAAVAG